MKESLTKFETKLANTLTVVEIIEKQEKKVPVLLTEEMKESVAFLVATRTAVYICWKILEDIKLKDLSPIEEDHPDQYDVVDDGELPKDSDRFIATV
ncbi:hypothetical protein RN001_009358 [Aquatica leii]|uniref:Uncharacterized protein n=1 Tax=Aquatica leii TaxID=1421715 RepID=A0AAN7P553_9COLE|nr:hypothetical protein RN001_009358 [Aquatica leii]